MVDPGFLPGFIGAVVSELMHPLIQAAGTAISCREHCRSLQTLLRDIEPVVHAIELSRSHSPSPSSGDHVASSLIPTENWLHGLREILKVADEIVTKCQRKRLLDPWSRYRTAIRIIEITVRIRELCQQAPILVLGVVLSSSLQLQVLDSRLMEIQKEMQKETHRLRLSIVTREALDHKYDKDRALHEIKTRADQIAASAWSIDIRATAKGESSSMILDYCAEEEDLQPVPQLVFGLDNLTKRLQNLLLQSECSGESSVCVGVWGPGGGGKTLLAKIIHNNPKVQNHFGSGHIYWLTVGRNPCISSLYVNLSNNIGLESKQFVNISIDDFKKKLYNKLRKKKVLLILDDVWEQSVLEWLQLADGPGSVTLITSRIESVLGKGSNTKRVVVSLLDEEDSWSLFSVHAFGGVDNVPKHLENLARSMATECKRLPLALKVIAAAMVGKNTPEEWRAALQRLRNSQMPDHNAEKELFNRLELSYKDLDVVDPRSKQCFLYFAAFPEDAEVEQKRLFELWISEQVVGDRGDDPMDDAYYLLGLLIGRSLIEIAHSRHNSSTLKIHDVLRDLALHILERNKPVHERDSLFRAGRELTKIPSEWMAGNGFYSLALAARRMSLMNNQLTELPRKLRAPCLRTLLLGNNPMKALPDGFLTRLENLMVLDLSDNRHLKSLPSSIGSLKLLVHLNVAGTLLEKLPDSVSNLKRLENFNLAWCTQLKYLPIGVTNLSSLKFLNLSGCGASTLDGGIWERQRPPKRSLISRPMEFIDSYLTQIASMEDICQISSLKELAISGHSILPLPTTLSLLVNLRVLTVSDFTKCTSLPNEMQKLVELEDLSLNFCKNLVTLPDWITCWAYLKRLHLTSCTSLSHLPALDALSHLVKLNLSECTSLKELPTSFTRGGAFPRLQVLRLHECGLVAFPPLQPGAMPHLLELHFSLNKLDIKLHKSLEVLTTLRRLNFRYTKIRNLGVVNFKSFPHLEGLYFSINHKKQLPPSLLSLPFLRFGAIEEHLKD